MQQLCKKIFKKRRKAYENQKDAMRDGLPYKGHDHREAIVQLFKIHDILPNLAKGGTKFDDKDFYRNIIVQTLKPRARVDYANVDIAVTARDVPFCPVPLGPAPSALL